MKSERIEHLLVKYLANESNDGELDELEQWINNPKNENVLKDFVKVHYAIINAMSNPDKRKIKEHLLREIRKDKKIEQKQKLRSLFKYAALVVILLGVGYFFQQQVFNSPKNKMLVPNEKAVTLRLSNGQTKVISSMGFSQIKGNDGQVLGEKKGAQLVYHHKKGIKN